MFKKLLRSTFVLVVLVLFTAAGLLLWPLPEPPRDGLAGNFHIRNVAVVDVRTGSVRRNMDVVLRDGRIASVHPAGLSGAHTALIPIDGSGKYVIPGLWDMHTHSLKIAPQYMHPLFIANGVTGVRDMSGCLSEPDSLFACIDDRRAWSDALGKGDGLSPRYVLQSSFQINGGGEVPQGFPDFFKARDAAEVRQLVAFHRAAGADFLKTYSELSPEAYRILADESRRQGLDLAGHRPLGVSLQQMLAAGQHSVEHPRLFLQECYRGAAEFRALADPLAAYDADLRWSMLDDHDAVRCAELMAAMADSDTWWTPTLQVLQMGALASDPDFRADPRLKYIPWLFRRLMWTPDADRAAVQAPDASGRELYPNLYRMALGHVGQAHAAGVKILAGTDAGDTYVFPGFGIHDELEQLVRGGLSPAAALRSATLDAAGFAGQEADYGSVATGKSGDLLLLDANPLDDIAHTRSLAGLFFNGAYYDRDALDDLLAFAAEQAGSLHVNVHLFRDAVMSPLFRVQVAD